MTRNVPAYLPAALMLGAVSQVGQVLFLREFLMVFHGNELSIGLILAAWLAWVGVGSRLGAALVNRTDHPFSLLALSAAGLLLVLPAALLMIRELRSLFHVLPGVYLSLSDMALACFVLMAPTCLLLGVQFVVLARIWRESSRAVDSSGAGKTYMVEALGSVLGGILFTFFMVHYFNALQAAIFAVILMLLAVYLLAKRRKTTVFFPRWLVLVPLGGLFLSILVFPFLGELNDWSYRRQWRQLTPDHRLMEVKQSKYGTISVLQRADQYSFFQSGHLIFSTAGPETLLPGLEEQEAVIYAHLSMVQHPDPERVLLIGGGLRGMLGEILKHPVQEVDYIELDEVLTRAARPYLPRATGEALADPRVRLLHTDGRLFVKSARENYDLIIIDAPDPTTAVLNRFYTLEFFREAEALLHPDGVLVTAVHSTPDLRGTALANRNTTLYHTLKRVFSHVLPAGDRFMYFFASNIPDRVSVEAPVLQERYLMRAIETEGFSHHYYQTLLQEDQLRRINWVVRNHGRIPGAHLEGPASVPLFPGPVAEQKQEEESLPPVAGRHFINSDLQPIGYYYTLMFWDELTRKDHSPWLARLLRVEFWWFFVLFCLPVLAAFGLNRVKHGNTRSSAAHLAVLYTVFTTGFSTMALQIALLFSFQSIYGFVYEIVGLIVAVFMCGLSLGVYFTNRWVKNKANINILALVQLCIALLAGAIALLLPLAAAIPSPTTVFILFSALTFTSGLINGVDFPLVAACYLALNRQAEKTAGTVYGVELFGACIGAAMASVILAPILGIIACCVLAGLANATAFVVLLLSRRSYPCLKEKQMAAVEQAGGHS